MAGNIIDFKLQSAVDPFIPTAPFAIGGGTSKIFSTGANYWTLSSGVDSICYDTTVLLNNTIASKMRFGTVNTSLAGASLINSSGNGYSALSNTTTNTVRIFRVNAWVMNATALWTSTSFTLATNDSLELRRNQTTGELSVYRNDIQLLNSSSATYTDNTYSVNLAGCHSRFGYVSTLESIYTPSQTVTNTTSPLIPNTSSSWTCTGFTNGSAVLSFGGVSIPVTITSGAFNATIPMIANNIAWPKLPATGVNFTLTQGVISSVVAANISLPNNYETIRDGANNPANFSGMVTTDATYLSIHFSDLGTPLTTNDTAVFPCVLNTGVKDYVITQESGFDVLTTTIPRTDNIFIYRAATGKYFEYIIILTGTTLEVVPNIPLVLNAINGRIQSDYPVINSNKNWQLATPYKLFRTDTIRQITHKPESGIYAFWRWASTKHINTYRFAWQGGHPPFRFTVYREGVLLQETSWVRTQSVVNSTMYNHAYPQYGYEFNWQPALAENGTTVNFTVLVESQDGQVLLINDPISVDNSRFKYFDSVSGNNTNAGTFEAPYQTFGYGYASVANAQNYIYYYKAGTYFIHNGTTMNDAAFNTTHCKSHVGLSSGITFDVSQGNFSNGGDDIYISNVTIVGGRPDKQNIRQIDFDARCMRVHFHKITFNTTVIGTQSPLQDNPSGFMFWNVTSPNYHEDIAITDCILASTSLSQMGVLFQCKNVIIEGLSSNNPTIIAPNGARILYVKDGVLNATIRHCNFVGNTIDGLISVASQDPISCGNVDMQFCRLVNTKSTVGEVSKWNNAVDQTGQEKPINYYIQRCSVDSLNSFPFHFENWQGLGYPVNYTGILWESTQAALDGRNTGGGVAVGTSSVKVADIDTVASGDLGTRGWIISSTLVI